MVEEELDETFRWIELIVASEKMPGSRLEDLIHENRELVSIITKAIITMRSKLNG